MLLCSFLYYIIFTSHFTHEQKEHLLNQSSINNHRTSSNQEPNRRPSSWTTKKVVVLGVMIGVMAATLCVSVLRDDSADPPAARTGPESDLLQHYPYVTITNKTPFPIFPIVPPDYFYHTYVQYGFCMPNYIAEGLAAGQTWTASSRGLCLVHRIHAALNRPDLANGYLTCYPYKSSGTSHSIYSILMKGDEECCVRSSHEIQECP